MSWAAGRCVAKFRELVEGGCDERALVLSVALNICLIQQLFDVY
jgi:hypothetical protein